MRADIWKDGMIMTSKLHKFFRNEISDAEKEALTKKEARRKYNREYCERPEVKERMKQYAIEYEKRPEVIERRKGYNKKYFAKKEVIERLESKEYKNQKHRYYIKNRERILSRNLAQKAKQEAVECFAPVVD